MVVRRSPLAADPSAPQRREPLPPLLSLEDPRCADPGVSGAKAAWLNRGIEAGLPILSGLVVPAPMSKRHLAIGADALGRRGSGGARLEISQTPLPKAVAKQIIYRSRELGGSLVVRSSSILEGAGQWSGAFTSYLEVHPDEVPRAVAGCWASVFGVSTLERHRVAGIDPGSVPMAVLIQPALDPDFGGTARLCDGEVTLVAVAGSPVPLVQGWEPGAQGRVPSDGPPSGPAIDLMGAELVERVARVLRRAGTSTGASACEWAVQGNELYLLQLTHQVRQQRSSHISPKPELETSAAGLLARLARRYPGRLGESLVLPWAVGAPERFLVPVEPIDTDPVEALAAAREHAATLSAEVWSKPEPAARTEARATLREVRGSNPGPHLDRLSGLRPPEPERAALVLGLLATVRRGLAELGAITWPELGWHLDPSEIPRLLATPSPANQRLRIGFDRWEPFSAAVTMARGRRTVGTPAAPGVAAGRMCAIPDAHRSHHFRPRDVIVSPYPTPHLAALLWDAAAVVTSGGSPAAHLFESARAVGVPAVCGVQLEEMLGCSLAGVDGEFALAVDGASVYATEW